MKISLVLFLTCAVFLAAANFYLFGYTWSPSNQHTNAAFILETLTAFGGFLFIIPAWVFFIRGERLRDSRGINVFSILNTLIGIVSSILVVWNLINLWPVWGFDMRIAFYRLQGRLPNGNVLFCKETPECTYFIREDVVCSSLGKYNKICLLEK